MNEPLQDRSFTLFWGARASTAVAFQMLSVAVGWQMYALTNSALYLGLVGLAQFLPMFLLSLVAGHVADRYDRRAVTRVCQLIQGFAAGALAWGSFSSWLSEASILALVFIIGASRAFEGPTMQALLPKLVPSHLIPRAVAWSSSAFQTATILGPALGGFLYAAGPATVYTCACILFLTASTFVAMIRMKIVPTQQDPISLASLFAGITFIKSRPVVLGAISMDMFAVLLGGATALLPIYARDILMTGPWGLGLLRSAPAIGALTMSMFLARHPLKHRVGRTMFFAVAVYGIATIVFAVSTSFALSLASLIILGSADVISVVIRQSLVQIGTPDEMRGRVSAVNSMFIGTSNQLGEFESGITAAWFGVVPAVLIGGIGTVLIVILWIRFFPQLLHTDTLGR